MDEIERSETRPSTWLDQVSNHFDPFKLVKVGIGPYAVRKRVLGVKGPAMARLLSIYRGPGDSYKRQVIYTWENPERGQPLPPKRQMSERARECYRRLLSDLVEAKLGGRFQLVARLGKSAWRFKLVGQCRVCGRPFEPQRRTDVHCARHRGKGKR